MEVLKIATAGSVDDGKSTLIGRLLYDTNSVPKDKLEAIEAISKRKSLSYVDLSLLTDGLIAEREQGITIDVAHIYFNSSTRKYIIADTPGHVEYTRNMITGASQSQASLILVDARKGISEQTKRHLYISTLLGIEHIALVVNKLDLVDYSEDCFTNITIEFAALLHQMAPKTNFQPIPCSALYGDNVAFSSINMPWYSGPTLLAWLEGISPKSTLDELPFRLSVQLAVRPQTTTWRDFRGFAGRISSGKLAVGDTITALPSGLSSVVKGLYLGENTVDTASAGDSVVVVLEDEIDISRGDLLAKGKLPEAQNNLNATLCCLSDAGLSPAKNYLLQGGVVRTKAKLNGILGTIDPAVWNLNPKNKHIGLNSIAKVGLKLAKPLYADNFSQNKTTGRFILIDEQTNNTVAVGFVEDKC